MGPEGGPPMAHKREHSRTTARRKSEALRNPVVAPPLDPAGDGYEGPSIRIGGLEIDEHIEREIERRVSSASVPQLSTKAWIESNIGQFPRESGEAVAAWARRLNAEAARQGRAFGIGHLTNTLYNFT
jgi:hypothetical protein